MQALRYERCQNLGKELTNKTARNSFEGYENVKIKRDRELLASNQV